MKRLDVMTNIAVMITSVALLGFLGNSWYENHHARPLSAYKARALVGESVTVPGVDFRLKKKTLIIAISSTCHFCQESQPFYRQLVEMHGAKTDLLAVLPMPQRDAEEYVHSKISSSLKAISTSLDAMGVSGMPTLLLVNSYGKVEQAWV